MRSAGGAGAGDRSQRPVRAIVGAFRDPAREQRLLGVRQRQVGFRRRHHVLDVVRRDSPYELALAGVARLDDRPTGAHLLERPFADIEPELRLALRRVGAMTAEAAIRQQGADLAGEVDPGHGRGLFVSADEARAGRECQYHDSAKPPVGPGLQTRPTRREHWRILSLMVRCSPTVTANDVICANSPA